MSFFLQRFRIFGLHGKFDIDIPITDNRLILVGVNGLGKTTVVNILYFLLTEQWTRLVEYDFVKVGIEINKTYLEVLHSHIEEIEEYREQAERSSRPRFSSSIGNRLTSNLLFRRLLGEYNVTLQHPLVEKIAHDSGLPLSIVHRAWRDFSKGKQGDLLLQNDLQDLVTQVKLAGEFQVLYLPTYRRIEQDLKAIFPDLEDRQLRDFASRNPFANSMSNRAHVELVHFGMQDVEGRISDELKTISEGARSQLSNLTGSYLRDIIRNTANRFDSQTINSLDLETVRDVLRRVEENTLNFEDKKELESTIQRIRTNQQSSSERDKYLAHFFSRLLENYNNLSQSERSIQRLVQICNKYLEGKRLRYNDNDYTAGIVDLNDAPINWRSLSSGEKQVASLFTHLILSKEKSQFVIIDEPELSLSVPWQKTLLPDVANSGSCTLLIAVTHSPFIYANELDNYAVDLAKCIRHTNQS